MHQRLRLHAASVKWRDQLLLAAVLVESEQHVAVWSSSDQPKIEHVHGRHDISLGLSPQPEAHGFRSGDFAGHGFGKLLQVMRSSVEVSLSRR